jgi:hypothetical protein
MTYTDEEKMADEALSIRLLAGFDVDTGKTDAFLKHNSPDEKKARGALARIVRYRVGGFAGELLALAIDPSTPSTWPNMKPTRRVKFESPARGKSSTVLRDILVVGFIRRSRINGSPKLEPHLAAAEKRFGLKRSGVHKIWKAYEADMERRDRPEYGE